MKAIVSKPLVIKSRQSDMTIFEVMLKNVDKKIFIDE